MHGPDSRSAVGSRTQEEERPAVQPQGLEALTEQWSAMHDAASTLRRSVGAASKHHLELAKRQMEEAKQLASTWSTMRSKLMASLPEDAELEEPEVEAVGEAKAEEGGCTIM